MHLETLPYSFTWKNYFYLLFIKFFKRRLLAYFIMAITLLISLTFRIENSLIVYIVLLAILVVTLFQLWALRNKAKSIKDFLTTGEVQLICTPNMIEIIGSDENIRYRDILSVIDYHKCLMIQTDAKVLFVPKAAFVDKNSFKKLKEILSGD